MIVPGLRRMKRSKMPKARSLLPFAFPLLTLFSCSSPSGVIDGSGGELASGGSPLAGGGGSGGASGGTNAGGSSPSTGGGLSSGGVPSSGGSSSGGSATAGGASSGGSSTGGSFPGGSGGGGVGGSAASGGTEVGGSGGELSSGGSGSAPAGGGTSSGGSGGSMNDAPCDVPDFIFDEPSPVGWASENGGTTGGGSAAPVLVTSLSEFQSQVSDSTPRVIYVQGDFSAADISFASNKTIIGCSSGAHLRGHLGIGSGDSNLIFRNLRISGYAEGNCALDPSFDSGEGCSSGSDAISVNGDAHHVWFDHCSIKDGTDGNLDITNDADFVTVSWTIFSYTPRTDNVGSDSTGSNGHRYCNLVGGTDTPPNGFPGVRPLNVTWHHNWWGDNVVERMPRVRFGRNHIFNNYFASNTSNYAVRAGIEARILLQSNYFEGIKDPHEFNDSDDQGSAFISVGSGQYANVYSGTSGEQATGGGGQEWNSPPYAFSADPAASVPSLVMSGAGPK